MKSSLLKSILLVDDDEISNLFNTIFIGKLEVDADVSIALNGQEALSFITGDSMLENSTSVSKPCLLLLDIKMPVMDGWAFLNAYEKLNSTIQKDIVIAMLTTSENEADRIRAMNNPHIKELLQKPLSEKSFSMLIDKYFSNLEVL